VLEKSTESIATLPSFLKIKFGTKLWKSTSHWFVNVKLPVYLWVWVSYKVNAILSGLTIKQFESKSVFETKTKWTTCLTISLLFIVPLITKSWSP